MLCVRKTSDLVWENNLRTYYSSNDPLCQYFNVQYSQRVSGHMTVLIVENNAYLAQSTYMMAILFSLFLNFNSD